MRGSCHYLSVEINIKPRIFLRTLDVYLLIFHSCKLPDLISSQRVKVAFIQKNILFGDHYEWGWSAEKEEVNKHPKCDANFYT